MKKNIKFFISLIIFGICIFLFNPYSFAGYQELTSINFDAKLNSDGTADITETWKITVEDTNTLFKTFDLDSSKYGEITNVKVKEILKSGVETNFIDTNTYAYHVRKGGFYALQIDDDKFEIAWGVSINSESDKVYQISYTVTDAIKTYNDCSEFYWQFIGDSNGIPADKVTGKITLPTKVQNIDNLKVWAHGPLNGEIKILDAENVYFEVEYLSEETMVEARVVTTENIFSRNQNIIKKAYLNRIIEEETKWAEEANEQRDRLKKEQENAERFRKILVFIVSLLGIALIAYMISKIVKYVKEIKKIKKIIPEQKIQYYRELPDKNATPAEAALLFYFDENGKFRKNISDIVSAEILNLSLKKAVSFEKDDKNNIYILVNDNINKEELKEDELSIYDLLVKIRTYTKEKSKNDKVDNKISMKNIETYAKNNDRTFLSAVEGLEKKAANIQDAKGNYSKDRMKTSKSWQDKKNIYLFAIIYCACASLVTLPFVLMVGMAIFIPFIITICFIVCYILCVILGKKTRSLTQNGANEQEKWKALSRYMEDFSLLNEREVPELALWERYLVYATAFGIADKVIKQLKVKYPEFADINGNYSYLYLFNNYNFSATLNSSMRKAYSAGERQRAARQAAMSSSYSSGRRRRRRIFIRRWPAEAAVAGMGGR